MLPKTAPKHPDRSTHYQVTELTIVGGGRPILGTGEPRSTPKEEGDLAVAERPKTKQPRKYVVVFHNDDYTTMEFVVHVLMKFFHMDQNEATEVMLHVHQRGYGVAGVFTRDIAETKVLQVTEYAKEHGHPLKCTAEPEGFGEPE